MNEDILARLAQVVESRKGADPDSSYVARLLDKGEDAILKKIGEEATEAVMAAKDGVRERIVAETADLWFHCLIMLAHYGLGPADVTAELARREGVSGLQEKAARSLAPPSARKALARARPLGEGKAAPKAAAKAASKAAAKAAPKAAAKAAPKKGERKAAATAVQGQTEERERNG